MWRAANAVISGLVAAAAAVAGLVMLGITLALAGGRWRWRRSSCCGCCG